MDDSLTLTERVLGRGKKAAHELTIPAFTDVLKKRRGRPPKQPATEHESEAAHADLGSERNAERRKSSNRFYDIYSNPPERINRSSRRGYPWDDLEVGEAFFVPLSKGEPTGTKKRRDGRKFETYDGELNGVKGRWCRRVA